ncbi:MAG: hypothetical protein M0D55_08670 [Elusimicrobiota bacterium]|nr:MAG: hypothetical protein M0D55_08670 [Elusimicrobiota bacterium]
MRNAILCALLIAPAAARADHARPRPGVRAWLDVEGSWLNRMDAGAERTWTIGFEDAKTGPIKDFVPIHDKLLHLILVSEDLSRFAHVHPVFDPETGRFTLTVNGTAGPDDRPPAELLEPGTWLAFAEAQSAAKGPLGGRFSARVRGKARRAPLVADAPAASGWIEKSYGVERAAVRVEPAKGMLHLAFKLDDAKGLEPWLGMEGHGILVSEGGERFYHLHAMSGDLTFMVHDEAPAPGLYKLWIQLKRRGEVLTFPFTVRL